MEILQSAKQMMGQLVHNHNIQFSHFILLILSKAIYKEIFLANKYCIEFPEDLEVI
ncbi:hypothetical protein X975_25562, partial [Stegodyphus mimosarum]